MQDGVEDALRGRVKAALRKRMRGLRKAMPRSACEKRSEKIAGRLSALEAIANARTVGLFWPIEEHHEVDLRPMGASLRGRGVRVAFPAIDQGTQAMTFRFVEDLVTVQPRGLGFSEPLPSEPEAAAGELDVIVVPALAIDPRGHRIGYGAGYYDRALPRFAPPAVTVAVAFDFQLIAEVPEMPGDVRVAWVVTDARSFAASITE